jgi:hypothetical protein
MVCASCTRTPLEVFSNGDGGTTVPYLGVRCQPIALPLGGQCNKARPTTSLRRQSLGGGNLKQSMWGHLRLCWNR